MSKAYVEKARSNFLDKANKRFDCKYNYNNFIYVNAKTQSIIICPTHGEFKQTPDKHLQSKYPCPYCFKPIKSKNSRELGKRSDGRPPHKGIDNYLGRLNLDTSKYSLDVTNYIGITSGEVILTCVDHGSETVSPPRGLLFREYLCYGCSIEGRVKNKTKSYDDFLNEVTLIYGNKYMYPENIEHFNRNCVLTIICPLHGAYQKKAQKHLGGQECYRCKLDEKIKEGYYPGGYTVDLLLSNPELAEKPSTLYYLKADITRTCILT